MGDMRSLQEQLSPLCVYQTVSVVLDIRPLLTLETSETVPNRNANKQTKTMLAGRVSCTQIHNFSKTIRLMSTG